MWPLAPLLSLGKKAMASRARPASFCYIRLVDRATASRPAAEGLCDLWLEARRQHRSPPAHRGGNGSPPSATAQASSDGRHRDRLEPRWRLRPRARPHPSARRPPSDHSRKSIPLPARRSQQCVGPVRRHRAKARRRFSPSSSPRTPARPFPSRRRRSTPAPTAWFHWQACIDAVGPTSENVEVRGSHSGLGFNIAGVVAISDRLAQADGELGALLPHRRRCGVSSRSGCGPGRFRCRFRTRPRPGSSWLGGLGP